MLGAGVRSLLFVPGDNEKLIAKALASQADAVIVDLEDAVAPERKAFARTLVGDLTGAIESCGKPVVVRVNAFDTALTAHDLAATIRLRPAGIMLPKCEGASDLDRLDAQLEVLEAGEGVDTGSTRILTVATETASATLGLNRSLGRGASRVWGLLWGGEDLAASLGAMANRDQSGAYTFPYQFARSQCLYAANAIGATAIDAVYTDFRDPEGLEAETRLALRDGFAAKAAIHPAQVEIINRLLMPGEDQLDWARRVVAVLETTGVARLDGKMVDLAHKRIALRLLARADAIRDAA